MPLQYYYQSEYLPARLVKAVGGWYVLFYQTNPATKKRQKFRPTYQLNRIKSKTERIKRAKEIVKELNDELLPFGYPFVSKDDIMHQHHELELVDELESTSIQDAMQLAAKIKTAETTRKRTIQMYQSNLRVFDEFLDKKKKIARLSVGRFSTKYALAFMDYLVIERGIGNRTYNNYIIQFHALFEVLVQREYLKKNPFGSIKKKKEPQKMRREFSAHEKGIIASYLYDNYRGVFLAVLFTYYGFIRPAELRRLKFKDFSVKDGTITLLPTITKNHKKRVVTIPDGVMVSLFKEDFFDTPANYFVFGKGLKPHHTKQCGHNTINYYHRKALKELKQSGKLESIDGLSFYSWKDTGITDHGEYLSILELMKQAGHQDPKVTMKYYNRSRPNDNVKKIEHHL